MRFFIKTIILPFRILAFSYIFFITLVISLYLFLRKIDAFFETIFTIIAHALNYSIFFIFTRFVISTLLVPLPFILFALGPMHNFPSSTPVVFLVFLAYLSINFSFKFFLKWCINLQLSILDFCQNLYKVVDDFRITLINDLCFCFVIYSIRKVIFRCCFLYFLLNLEHLKIYLYLILIRHN